MALFTKRHYNWLATYGRNQLEQAAASQSFSKLIATRAALDGLALKLADDNPAFDIEQFRTACGLNPSQRVTP
jgi:hypothetical protein